MTLKRIQPGCIVLASVCLLGHAALNGAERSEERQAFVESYCLDCHNFDDYSGGLAFDLLPLDDLQGHEDTWEKVLTKAGVGMMPPPGEKQPQQAQLTGFLDAIKQDLADVAQLNPNPGVPALHRMNAVEFQNAIRDLLHLPIDAPALLPADDSIEGFDNIAEGLVVSPALIQAYISAAGKISRLALGDSSISSSITTYQAADPVQSIRLEGLPLGTRGGVVAEQVFPLEGEYEITVSRSRPATFMRTPVGLKDEIEVLLDGERLHVFPPGEAGTVTVSVSAGAHTIAAAFVRKQQSTGINGTYSGYFANTRVTSLAVTGPIAPTGPGDTASRRKIFSCYPRELAEEENCAREIMTNLAMRAYRRPVDDAALEVLMEFFVQGQEVNFETGIQYGLARILVDPKFIYRLEEEPFNLQAGEIFQIDDFDLASRLSFFLWSSIPDDELLLLASAGQLNDPATLQAQVQRMLADPKAKALVSNFAPQWLSLQLLENAAPLSDDFDEGLRDAMGKETELLIESVFLGKGSVLQLLQADYTFVNERLARHYGFANIKGDHFRRITLPDTRRMGLLGHASILTATSAPNRTSPVMRGDWILETLLGAPPPEPPPGVEANIDVTQPAGSGPELSVRQRLEEHRANPSCAACHNIIDPIGFALENFDLVGRWQEESDGVPINSSAQLWDGTELYGAQELRAALLARKDMFVETLTEKLMTYALGRVLSHSDLPVVRAIVEQAGQEDYPFAMLVQGIVASPAFQMRIKAETEQVAQQ